MGNKVQNELYPQKEEFFNVFSHAIGLGLSVLGLFLLVKKASVYGDTVSIVSFTVFGLSMILLYAASTFYHYVKDPVLRYRLKILDHIAIFILIAGSYTPFALVTLRGKTGWLIFGVVWGIAFVGTILKLFFTGRFKILSTLLYVAMGWVIIFAINPLMENLPEKGLWWLFSGGVAYTLGAILYSIKQVKYNHAIFHFFVLIGTFCHYISVYLYVQP